ncbi:transposase [Tropicibacter sp. R15_0]|nr:transposase [Tropicibacter sp. R15_0]
MAGANRRLLPEQFGKWNSVYVRFNKWCRDGVFEHLFNAMMGDPDFEYILFGSTIGLARQHSAGVQV